MKPFTCAALCFAMLTGPAVAGETKTTPRQPGKNVALHAGGVLRGVALNTAAKPIANADVAVRFGPHIVARTKTRKDGSFVVRGLRSGTHVVSVGSNSTRYTFWPKNAAPPTALKTVAVNGNSNAVRGQYIPPVGLETVAVAVGAGLIGGIIGYQVKDDAKKSTPSSP